MEKKRLSSISCATVMRSLSRYSPMVEPTCFANFARMPERDMEQCAAISLPLKFRLKFLWIKSSAAQQAEDVSYWPIYFKERTFSGAPGEQVQLTLSGADASRNVVEVRADASVVYSIADESIATVTPDGKVTFVKAGKTALTVTVTQDGYSASATTEIIVE